MKTWFGVVCVLAFGCQAPAAAGCPSGVLVVTTDEVGGSGVGVLPLDGSPPSITYSSELGADPALASSNGRSFFLARDTGTIFELDACGHGGAPIATQRAGEGASDPWDVAAASDGSLWIARFSLPSALVVDPGGAPLATIDFSDLGPNASGVRIVRDRAFFVLERLTPAETSAQPGMVAVVDTASRARVAAVALVGRNPQALTSQALDDAGGMFLADAGDWDHDAETDAGIERFDTGSLTTKLLYDEAALGGTASMVAVNGGCGAAIVADATGVNRTSLVVFPSDGSASPSVALGPTTGFDLRGLVFAQGELLVGDARPVAGRGYAVHTFAVGASCALTPGADSFVPSLPPLAFAP